MKLAMIHYLQLLVTIEKKAMDAEKTFGSLSNYTQKLTKIFEFVKEKSIDNSFGINL